MQTLPTTLNSRLGVYIHIYIFMLIEANDYHLIKTVSFMKNWWLICFSCSSLIIPLFPHSSLFVFVQATRPPTLQSHTHTPIDVGVDRNLAVIVNLLLFILIIILLPSKSRLRYYFVVNCSYYSLVSSPAIAANGLIRIELFSRTNAWVCEPSTLTTLW